MIENKPFAVYVVAVWLMSAPGCGAERFDGWDGNGSLPASEAGVPSPQTDASADLSLAEKGAQEALADSGADDFHPDKSNAPSTLGSDASCAVDGPMTPPSDGGSNVDTLGDAAGADGLGADDSGADGIIDRPSDIRPAGRCDRLAYWSLAAAPLYSTGTRIKNGKPPREFECRGEPQSGWCPLPTYQPGLTGTPWRDAWIDRGPCNDLRDAEAREQN